MATSEERRLLNRKIALEAELDRRRSTSDRQAAQILGHGRNDVVDERASDTSEAQAERATRGHARRWHSEESRYVEPSREDAYRAFERQQIRRDNGGEE